MTFHHTFFVLRLTSVTKLAYFEATYGGGEDKMNEVKFYNVKTRDFVTVPTSQVKKKKYEKTTKSGSMQVRYAVRANVNGTNLTKFVSKDMYDSLSVPEE